MPIDRRGFLGGTAAAALLGTAGVQTTPVNRSRKLRLGLN